MSRPSRRGSSLVDVLVAASIVGTAVLAAAATVLGAAAHQRANARIRAVTPVLASLLDEVRAADYAELETRFAAAPRALAGIPGTQNAQATFTVVPVETGSSRWTTKRVTVALTWGGAAGPMTVTASTLVAERATLAETIPAATPGGESAAAPPDVTEGTPAGDGTTAGDGVTNTSGTDAGTSPDAGLADPGIVTTGNGNGNGNGNANGHDR